jgi:hypothetical protein
MLKQLCCLLFFLQAFSEVSAQRNTYIYIQTENNQLFYVKLNGKILNASEGGFIIIPKIQPGNYEVTLGFPKNVYPSSKFTINVSNSSLAYLFKNLGSNGWALVNRVTSHVQYPIANTSEVVSIQKVPLVATNNNFDSVAAARPTKITNNASNIFKNTITKLSQNQSDSAFRASYLDAEIGKTINIYIPFEKELPVVPKTIECTSQATDSLLAVTIAEMNAIQDTYDKLLAIKNNISTVCFATSQISKIGKYLPSDEARYKLFEFAYPYVIDQNQYFKLTDDFSESIYKQMLIRLINKN